MKSAFLIAASLIVGTAAIAQTTTTPTDAAPTTTDSTMAPQAAPATDSAMQAPATDPAAAAPAADASTAPAPAGGMNAMPTPTTADMSSYPACSRSVQDHCVQKGKRR